MLLQIDTDDTFDDDTFDDDTFDDDTFDDDTFDDDTFDFVWGDMGTVYFLIHKPDSQA